MRTLPFSLLVLTCLLALLGLRFALDPLVRHVAETIEDKSAGGSDAVMALPPKPTGSERPASEDGTGEGQALLTLEGCLGMATDVQDVCLQQLARQKAARDPDGALQVCERIRDEELRWECHADVAENVAPVDRTVAERICEGITPQKWRGQCNFGIGLALAETDWAYALARCDHAEAFRDFCRHDVVGEVALVNVEPAIAFCAREEGDELTRKTCWHGIGKYLARRDFKEAEAACRRATQQWQGTCFHAIGWGASERDPDGALANCNTLPDFSDKCRQGVAYQLKRFDPERGIALCEGMRSDSVRSDCLAFLKR